jgi:class 3 adenylate cyclase/ferritin-like protein
MYQLEEIAFRYLPRTLIEHWEKTPDIRPVWYQWLKGSLMHCDVTGFTAMSEKLGEVGKEGAELMAGVLNQFFERMLAIAVSWGGIQIKFGGDAMLLYFPDEQHAQRAAACGLEMQSVMHEFSHVRIKDDYHKLRMRIGIHSGQFFVCSAGQVGTKVGQGEGLLHYYIVGKDVNKAADTEPMAEPGQVVVSTETYNLLNTGDCKMLATNHENIWLVKKIAANKHRLSFFDDTNLPHHILQRYLMRPIAEGLSSGKSEHRRTTIIFIYVTGIADLIEKEGEQIALSQINEYTNLIIATAEKYGGHFAASDASEHGDKLIVLFGAQVMQDKQESSAMRFALEVIEKMNSKKLDLKHQIGINTGYVFCGEIGSSARREYTVIGDSVNLSARLMAAANENEIIVSDFTVSNCGKEFMLEQLEPIMVKGKKDPVSICKLVGASNDIISITDSESSIFFGRYDELTYLRNFSNKVKEKNTDSLLLLGEAGVGKTYLVNEFLRSSNNYKCLSTICRSYDSNSAYSCFRHILLSLVGLDHSSENDEIINKLNKAVDEFIPGYKMFTPLLIELVGVSSEVNSELKSLDAKTKREKRLETITNLIFSISQNTPVVIHVDNLQWVDSSSCEIFVSLLNNKKSNILILSTARNKSEIKSYANKLTENIFVINNLDKDDAMQMLTTMSACSDEQYLESIYLKTQGNPLFIMEMAKSSELEAGNLPDTIYDIVMNKVDKLSPENKFFLQEASVVGQEFSVEEIIPVVE